MSVAQGGGGDFKINALKQGQCTVYVFGAFKSKVRER
jgi:hypothetical protein